MARSFQVALLFLAAGIASGTKALLPAWWRPMSGKNCDKENFKYYNARSAAVTLVRSKWGRDANAGWRFCGISLSACKVACIKMGKCSNVYYTPNGCCFPSRTWGPKCRGIPGGRNGKKHYVVTPHWYSFPGGNCDKANNAYYRPRSAKARSLLAGWGHDANAGYRWCNGKGAGPLFHCQVACAKLGNCKTVYQTPNGCCFPDTTALGTQKRCRGVPGGRGGRKYKMVWQTPKLDERGQDIGKFEMQGELEEEIMLEVESEESVFKKHFLPIFGGVVLVGSVTVAAMVHKRYKRESEVSERELLATLE